MTDLSTDLWKAFCTELAKRKYTLIRQLTKPSSRERNSTASVWLAQKKGDFEDSLEEHVLKISSEFSFPDEVSANSSEKREKLQARERLIYQTVAHANIPAFKGADEIIIGGVSFHYFATQYVNSPTLLELIDAEKKVSEKDAKIVLQDILFALDYVHTQADPIFHRDIRPSNILFDGTKAYLFDFNFSVQGTSSRTTVVDNVGYYPLDTYSGNQDPTQDLVALGNVIIAAALAREIFFIRDEQNIGFADPVSVEGLPYSPQFKGFLKKLTAGNPGLRYQNARQALDDLVVLDTISVQEMEQRASTIKRDARIMRMLEALQKKDRLFSYNVPSSILETYSDDKLLDHLRETYMQEEFLITDPAEIQRYVRVNDMVVAREQLTNGWVDKYGDENKNYLIPKETEGVVLKTFRDSFWHEDNSLKVAWIDGEDLIWSEGDHKRYNFLMKNVNLVVQNRIHFSALYKDCFETEKEKAAET